MKSRYLQSTNHKAKSTQSRHPRESSVWDYFIYNEKKHKSICQIGFDQEGSPLCNTEIAGKHTTNFKAHLKAKHPRELAELAKKDAEKEKTKELKRKSQDGAFFSATAQLTISMQLPARRSTLGKVSDINA